MVSGLTECLGRFLNVDGVTAVAVVSKDGFIIDSVGGDDVDLESLGVIVATNDDEISQAPDLIELKGRYSTLLGVEQQKILMGQAAEELLALVVDEAETLQNIALRVQASRDKLMKVLAPEEGRHPDKQKIYRYSSDQTSKSFSEFTPRTTEQPTPVDNINEELTSGELLELAQLTVELFSKEEEPSTQNKPNMKLWRFQYLLNGLYQMVRHKNRKADANFDEVVDTVLALQKVFLSPSSNYYQVLALHEKADIKLVKKHYGIFKEIYSCDERVDPDYSCILKISKAFLVLRSPKWRWAYDSKRFIGAKGRETAVWLSQHEWTQKMKARLTNNLRMNIQNKHVKKLASTSTQGVRSLVGGVKKLYSGIKKNTQ